MKSKRPIPPHRILLDDDVVLEYPNAWHLKWGEMHSVIKGGDVVPHWEPGIDIRVRNSVRLNASAKDRLCGNAADTPRLQVVLVATTAGGLQTLTVAKAPLLMGGESEAASLDAVLDGDVLAKDVSLHLGILLEHPQSGGDRLTPRSIGARLWGMEWRARIEGGRARLAIDAVDFTEYFGNASLSNGLVHVIVADDPLLDIEQGLAVYLNARHPAFVTAVSRRDPHATAILWDAVIRRVIVSGAELQFSLTEAYDQGSLGAQWRTWTSLAFPKICVEEILDRHRTSLSAFEARIQGWTKMGEAFGTTAGGKE